MDAIVQRKGIREGLLVTLGEGEWPDLQVDLLHHIDQKIDFLRGGKLYVDVGNQVLHAVELSRLRDAISERSLILWGVLSNSPTTEQTAQLLGLATRLSRPSQQTQYRDTTPAPTSLKDGEEAILVKKTLRSGFSLKSPASVIVIGDVNPGAEVVAGGSILVWGHLRGNVHAGADGELEACVFALDLSPSMLRIANLVAVPITKRIKPQPEVAKIQEGKVIVEIWKSGFH
jgi:septum site-determining protein MinC